MAFYVDVSTTTIDWIIQQCNFALLPERIQKNLLAWKSGHKKPTSNQLIEASKATYMPFGYFFLTTPPQEDYSFVDYRTVDSEELIKPSRNLIDTIHNMQNIQNWAENYLIQEGFAKNRIVGLLRNINENNYVDVLREELNIDINWYEKSKTSKDSFKNFRNIISNLGVFVMMSGIVENNTKRILNINEFRAFTIINDYVPLIFINSNDSPNGKLFSLIHEFAHICLGENSLFNDRFSNGTNVKEIEKKCNKIAAELLVPQKIFIKEWNREIKKYDEEQCIKELAQMFKCGITVIARKALDNNFITFELYNKLAKFAVAIFNQTKNDKEGGGNFYTTTLSRIDNRFLSMLQSSVQEGKTQYTEAYRLTNTKRGTYDKLIEKACGVS